MPTLISLMLNCLKSFRSLSNYLQNLYYNILNDSICPFKWDFDTYVQLKLLVKHGELGHYD